MSDIHEYLIEHGRCCVCEASLKDSELVNMVMLSKKAPWKYPIWGNILAKKETAMGYALAVVCDECVNPETGQIKTPIKYAIEVQGGEQVEGSLLSDKLFTKRFIIYHIAEDLEDGQPELKGTAESMALQFKADMERDQLLNAITGVLPDDPIAVAYRGSMEETNEIMLRNSAYYLMLINQSYVNGLRDPEDPQHHDLIRQLEVAQEMRKPAVMILDETITDEDREYIKEMTRNLEVRETFTHDFSVKSADLHEKVRAILKSFEDHAPPECRASCPWVDACPNEYKLRSCEYPEIFKEKGMWKDA